MTFRLKAPAAKEVWLSGVTVLTAIGTGNKPVPFKKGDNGICSTIGFCPIFGKANRQASGAMNHANRDPIHLVLE